MLNDYTTRLRIKFIDWTRSVAMWIVWNVPIGKFAPKLMGYALNCKSEKVLKD